MDQRDFDLEHTQPGQKEHIAMDNTKDCSQPAIQSLETAEYKRSEQEAQKKSKERLLSVQGVVQNHIPIIRYHI